MDGELPTTDHPSMTGMHEWRMGRMSGSPARYERGGSLSSHRSTGASSPHTQSLALLRKRKRTYAPTFKTTRSYDVPMAEPPNGARPLAYHSRAPRARLWAPRQRFAHPPTFPFSATMQGVRAMASNLACSHLSFTGRSQSTCRVCRPPALCARWTPIADDRGRHAHDNDPMTIGPPR